MERFFTEHAESKNKPRTGTEYRKLANGVILPQLGAYRIDAITRSQVAKLHHEQRETPYLNVEKSFYSAPFRLIDQSLMVQVTPDSVRIYQFAGAMKALAINTKRFMRYICVQNLELAGKMAEIPA